MASGDLHHMARADGKVEHERWDGPMTSPTTLESLTPGTVIRGVLPDAVVTVVQTEVVR